jgi:hypothetical protein
VPDVYLERGIIELGGEIHVDQLEEKKILNRPVTFQGVLGVVGKSWSTPLILNHRYLSLYCHNLRQEHCTNLCLSLAHARHPLRIIEYRLSNCSHNIIDNTGSHYQVTVHACTCICICIHMYVVVCYHTLCASFTSRNWVIIGFFMAFWTLAMRGFKSHGIICLPSPPSTVPIIELKR